MRRVPKKIIETDAQRLLVVIVACCKDGGTITAEQACDMLGWGGEHTRPGRAAFSLTHRPIDIDGDSYRLWEDGDVFGLVLSPEECTESYRYEARAKRGGR